jgi:hypothetical protein
MGRDISIIHSHKLDTSNVEMLANDLIKRLDVNIEYGYFTFSEEYIAKLLQQPYEEGRIYTGKIEKNPKFPWMSLIDSNFLEKLALERFGEQIFYDKRYWYSGELLIEEHIKERIEDAKVLDYEFESIRAVKESDSDKYWSLPIFKDYMINDIPDFYSRWNFFCYQFTKNHHYDIGNEIFDNELLDFRKQVQYYSSKFGSNSVYYIDDQSDVLEGLGEGSRGEMLWTEIPNFIKEKCGDLILDIPEYLLNPKYRKTWIDSKNEPLAFVDNFKDFK